MIKIFSGSISTQCFIWPEHILQIVSVFQGTIFPIYESTKLTDDLHKVVGIETDYEFITKRKMKEIQKLSKQPPEK